MMQLMDYYEFDGDGQWTTLVDGMHQLPRACLAAFMNAHGKIEYNSRVIALHHLTGGGAGKVRAP